MGVIFQNGFKIVSSGFTINGGEFTGYYSNNGMSASNTNGFINLYGYNNLSDCSYVLHNAITNIMTRASNAANAAGMQYNTFGYVWNVTWADNTIGLCRIGIINNSSNLVLSPIDPSDNRWQSGDINTKSLAGTYNFPATFTPYFPLIAIGSNTTWC